MKRVQLLSMSWNLNQVALKLHQMQESLKGLTETDCWIPPPSFWFEQGGPWQYTRICIFFMWYLCCLSTEHTLIYSLEQFLQTMSTPFSSTSLLPWGPRTYLPECLPFLTLQAKGNCREAGCSWRRGVPGVTFEVYILSLLDRELSLCFPVPNSQFLGHTLLPGSSFCLASGPE